MHFYGARTTKILAAIQILSPLESIFFAFLKTLMETYENHSIVKKNNFLTSGNSNFAHMQLCNPRTIFLYISEGTKNNSYFLRMVKT